ncbi:MAG: Glycosyl transferase, group 1 [Candidatus Uhrbacteria bacterium GW2011_GWF2_40_263]|nr:MAG: Glycosyl transferase, group 1 [Candidatus Uhrbacteria bacterium GW2011_GWF2_40_263]
MKVYDLGEKTYNNRIMRIVFIGQKGLEIGESGGGVEQHVSHLAHLLAQRGHHITVYARKRYGSTYLHDEPNIHVKYLPTIHRKNLEAIFHTILATIDVLFRSYDIIHYHGVGPSTVAWIPRLFKRRARTIVTFHSQDRFHRKWSWFARQYLHLGEWTACWFPHATICVSHGIQLYVRDHYHRQIIYIPNGVDIQEVQEDYLLRQFHLQSKKYLLNVSRLVPHKGQHYLLEAYARLVELMPKRMQEMDLVFVGAHSYTIEYERQLQTLATGNPHIHFLGHRSGEELKQLFAHAYLYVQPSESEGLSVVVLEAMSYGVPVLVSDIQPNLEAMKHTGFSFKNKDVDDLTRALRELLDRPELIARAGTEVKEMMHYHFNWQVIGDHTEIVYRSVRH